MSVAKVGCIHGFIDTLKPGAEDVEATRPPAIEQASAEQLKVLAQRLRRARDRARDIAAGQKREMR